MNNNPNIEPPSRGDGRRMAIASLILLSIYIIYFLYLIVNYYSSSKNFFSIDLTINIGLLLGAPVISIGLVLGLAGILAYHSSGAVAAEAFRRRLNIANLIAIIVVFATILFDILINIFLS